MNSGLPEHPPEDENGREQVPVKVTSILKGVLLIAILILALQYWDQKAFLEWKIFTSPLLFFALLCLLPPFAVPTTPFFLVAGATFPTWIALLGSAVGIACSNLLCWLLAHSWLRKRLVRILGIFGYDLPRMERGRAIRVALLIKLAPGLPTVVKNYAMALSGISLPLYMGITWIITLFYAVALIFLGESIVTHDYRDTAIAGTILVGLALLCFFGFRYLQGKRNLGSRYPSS